MMLGMDVAINETEVTTSQADSSDDDDDDDNDDQEWMNSGADVTPFNNTDVLTTRRVMFLSSDTKEIKFLCLYLACRMSKSPGNSPNLLEFFNSPGNTGNLLEF